MDQQNKLPKLSENVNQKTFETSSKRSILLFKIPKMNLYVISDCNNFGSHWIEVNFSNKIYTTRYLMGANEDLFSVIARKFAQDIVESTIKPQEDDDIQDLSPRTFMLNISLRNTEPSEIREISSELKKL